MPRLRPEGEPRTRQALRRLRLSARSRGAVLPAGGRVRGHRGRGAEAGRGRAGLDLPLLRGGQPRHQHLLLRLRRPPGRSEDASGHRAARRRRRGPSGGGSSHSQKARLRGGEGLGLGCLGLIALIALFVFLGRPKPTTLTVTGFHWTRTIAVEELRPVTEQAWEGQVPSGARVLGSSREVHHVDHIQTGTRTRTRTVSERVQTGTQRVKTGTRNLGNGYFEDVYENRPVYESRSHQETYQEPVYVDRPVYRQRIRYEVEKWMPGREAKAEGQDHNAVWPDPRPGSKEREGKRTELYEVLFRTAKGENATWKAPNEQVWRGFEEGRTYKGKVYGDGRVAEVGNL